VPATPDMPEPVRPAPDRTGRTRRRWIVVAALSVVAAITAVAAVAVFAGDDGSRRREAVAERGANVMPFDLDATTHVFDRSDTGGIQTVVADDPTDSEQIALVRDHLREEVERFGVGDFGDPAAVHGEEMPGIAVLEEDFEAVETTYRDRPGGGEITYRSSDPAVVAALHDWFEAQLSDHGGHAEGATGA